MICLSPQLPLHRTRAHKAAPFYHGTVHWRCTMWQIRNGLPESIRCLATGGSFVLSAEHPVFTAIAAQALLYNGFPFS
ncbi:hypothetical protein [Chitinophaga sp. OAE865]|uniref:hypothetical protein n=1 Tax=Chitinophaga sp. OAE865 TaxID=2817898 RepID=UPI001AE7277F